MVEWERCGPRASKMPQLLVAAERRRHGRAARWQAPARSPVAAAASSAGACPAHLRAVAPDLEQLREVVKLAVDVAACCGNSRRAAKQEPASRWAGESGEQAARRRHQPRSQQRLHSLAHTGSCWPSAVGRHPSASGACPAAPGAAGGGGRRRRLHSQIVTGASTRCTLASSTRISTARSHSCLTSLSLSGSQRLSCGRGSGGGRVGWAGAGRRQRAAAGGRRVGGGQSWGCPAHRCGPPTCSIHLSSSIQAAAARRRAPEQWGRPGASGRRPVAAADAWSELWARWRAPGSAGSKRTPG